LRALLTAMLVVALVGAPTVGMADEEQGQAGEVSRESGLGAAAAVSSLVYGPVKLVYALGGLVIGGCAWAFTAGDTEVASIVWKRSLRGDYVITPAILTGEDSLEFVGRDYDDAPIRTENVAVTEPPGKVYEDPTYDELGW
jgi:hypothetical protein